MTPLDRAKAILATLCPCPSCAAVGCGNAGCVSRVTAEQIAQAIEDAVEENRRAVARSCIDTVICAHAYNPCTVLFAIVGDVIGVVNRAHARNEQGAAHALELLDRVLVEVNNMRGTR